MKKKTIQFLIKIACFLLVVGIFNFFLKDYFSLQTIQQHHVVIKQYVNNHFLLSRLLYVFIYVGLTSLFLPLIAIFSLMGGLMFSFWWAMSLVMISFFFHCFIMTFLVRYFFKEYITSKFKHALEKVNKNIEKKGIWYVVFLRMSSIAPSAIVNCAAAITNMNILVFSIVSVVSAIPALSILVYSGRLLVSIESIFDLYNKTTITILISFALLSLVPLVYSNKKTR